MHKLSQKSLAASLSLSGSMISKLKAMGMPVNSLEAARTWREANLNPSLVKDVRRVSRAAMPSRAPQDVTKPLKTASLSDVMALAEKAVEDFVAWQALLKAAMRLLPRNQWERLAMPCQLWDLLTEPELSKFQNSDALTPPLAEDISTSSQFENDEAGDFVYMLACGMVRFNDAIKPC